MPAAMFLGTVPKPCIEQIFRVVDVGSWPSVYVCCSGTFRIERAIHQRHPAVPMISNDVSLYSVMIGRLAAKQPVEFTFVEDLAWIETEHAPTEPVERVAALMVACDLARYAKKNAYAQRHFAAHRAAFPALLEKTRAKLASTLPLMPLAGFNACDWEEHIRLAIEAGAGLLAFPPFFKGGYEVQYKFINANVRWEAPSYEIYDPKRLAGIVETIDASGIPYVVLTDQHLPGRKPNAEFVAGRRLPHYLYARSDRSSRREFRDTAKPFRYRPLDPAALTATSEVKIVRAESGHLTFLKDVYLAKRIVHIQGQDNYLVYLDGMLAGGLIYSIPRYGEQDAMYLVSDFSTSRERRLSKLIALLSTSRVLADELSMRHCRKVKSLFTTAFSPRPVSMKYRGIFELTGRKPSDNPDEGNILQYQSAVRDRTPQELYAEWWAKNHDRRAA